MGKGEIKSLGWTDTPTYKIGNQQGPTLLHRELYLNTLYEVGANVTVVLDHEFQIIITILKYIFISQNRTSTINTILPTKNNLFIPRA